MDTRLFHEYVKEDIDEWWFNRPLKQRHFELLFGYDPRETDPKNKFYCTAHYHQTRAEVYWKEKLEG